MKRKVPNDTQWRDGFKYKGGGSGGANILSGLHTVFFSGGEMIVVGVSVVCVFMFGRGGRKEWGRELF